MEVSAGDSGLSTGVRVYLKSEKNENILVCVCGGAVTDINTDTPSRSDSLKRHEQL